MIWFANLSRGCTTWVVALVVSSALAVAFGETVDAASPNIVMILADDLGYGDLSSYGATDLRSPNIDKLVSAGIRFDNFYANCPVCSPTRASLLTGRYPELVGVPGVIRTHAENSWGYLDPDAIMLPTLLKQAGYHTAIVGKWHLGLDSPNRPNERGFDHFYGYLGDMMDDYYSHRRHGINYMRREEIEVDPQGHTTDLFTSWACEYVADRSQKDTPFFLYLPYNAPHTPIQPPPEWIENVQGREAGIADQRAKLVALIEHMDDGIGRVMRTLEETGVAENTLVIFSSDNGGQLSVGANNGPLRDGKQSMYEGGIKVPFCVVWPGKIAKGSRSDRIGLTMDIYPMICAAAGITVEHNIDGRSILPTCLGESQPAEDRDVFFHRREGGEQYGGLTINAMRRGDWKLLQNSPFAPLELYNLNADPREEHDLSKRNRGKFVELSAALRVQIQRGGAVPWQPPTRRDVE
ncbi:MAG: sulfatase [Planctomycetota bacterium]|nr:sulfatase [Planctomycetota bacterium]